MTTSIGFTWLLWVRSLLLAVTSGYVQRLTHKGNRGIVFVEDDCRSDIECIDYTATLPDNTGGLQLARVCQQIR